MTQNYKKSTKRRWATQVSCSIQVSSEQSDWWLQPLWPAGWCQDQVGVGVSQIAIRANEPGTLPRTQPRVVPCAVLPVDEEQQQRLVIAKCRETTQLCFTFLWMTPTHVQLQTLDDHWDQSSICGSNEPGPSQAGEAGHSHQVMNSSTPLADPSVLLCWVLVHDSWFKILFNYSNLIWLGQGQRLVCFRHLHLISAERAGGGWQEGQRNSHSRSSAQPCTEVQWGSTADTEGRCSTEKQS